MNEEMVKSARLQLEIDKLNARTKEDSLIIQQRESEILLAEQEIKEAKTQIEIQKLVIKQKNTMLMFSVSAMLFFVILSIMIYKSWRDKKRTNAILEKQNLEIANKNKKIIDSIRYAQTIQQAILPIGTTIDKYFDWFIIYQPKDIVSGDFYWFTHIEETGKSIFAVVDCTGHGVPGAFMSMIGNRLLIEAVKEKGITRPVEILNDVDASIRIALMQDETLNNDGMDMCICTVEYAKNGKCLVEFAGAKRPIFYSEAKGGLKHIKGTVRGIGGKKRIREKAIKPFEEHVLMLHKGDMIYLTTDGFFDLQSSDRKKFGRLNFMEILEKNYSQNPEYQRIAIMDALHLHLGAENQIDDITIMGIKL
jgi:serine phosphatase RsbU (regulator of sigma subunit)